MNIAILDRCIVRAQMSQNNQNDQNFSQNDLNNIIIQIYTTVIVSVFRIS